MKIYQHSYECKIRKGEKMKIMLCIAAVVAIYRHLEREVQAASGIRTMSFRHRMPEKTFEVEGISVF